MTSHTSIMLQPPSTPSKILIPLDEHFKTKSTASILSSTGTSLIETPLSTPSQETSLCSYHQRSRSSSCTHSMWESGGPTARNGSASVRSPVHLNQSKINSLYCHAYVCFELILIHKYKWHIDKTFILPYGCGRHRKYDFNSPEKQDVMPKDLKGLEEVESQSNDG